MSNIEAFSIILERLDGIYNAGETCTGKIVLKTNKKLKIKRITIRLREFVTVPLKETKNGKKKFYSMYNDCTDSLLILADKNTCPILSLEANEYHFPFDLLIPNQFPTSFEHTDFKIRYIIEASIQLPWTSDKNVSRTISVINPIDLNSSPSLKQPISFKFHDKQFGFSCFESQLCNAQIGTPRTGYVGGEIINFISNVDNQSNKTLQMSVKLLQHVKITTKAKTMKVTRTISSRNFSFTIDPNTDKEWNSSIQIPPVCPSTNDTSGFLSVSYDLRLELDPSGFSQCLNVSLPIFVGTIPFRDDDYNLQEKI
jgi:hypothetical protein